MGDTGIDVSGTILLQSTCCLTKRAGGGSKVINDDYVFPFDFTDDMHHLYTIGRISPLVHNRKGSMQPLGKCPRGLDAAYVWRNNYKIGKIQSLEIFNQNRSRKKMVQRNVKKSLNLRGVKIHCQHPVCSCGCD